MLCILETEWKLGTAEELSPGGGHGCRSVGRREIRLKPVIASIFVLTLSCPKQVNTLQENSVLGPELIDRPEHCQKCRGMMESRQP